MGLFTKDNIYNYFRGEIEFDDELDHLFKIQNNKSRYNVPRRLRDLIRDRCMATINQIARDHKKERASINVRKQQLTPPSAEKAAAKAAQHPKFKRRDITPEQKAAAEKEIAQRVETMVKMAKQEGKEEIEAAKQVLEQANISRDKRIADAEEAVKSAQIEAKHGSKPLRSVRL